MKLPKENVKKQKGVKSYIPLRQSTFRGAGIKWKALEGRAGAGSDQDGQMSQSLGEIRTENIHWEGSVSGSCPQGAQPPHSGWRSLMGWAGGSPSGGSDRGQMGQHTDSVD